MVGHIHLTTNVYKDIHEIIASLGMNLIVAIGFIIEYKQTFNDKKNKMKYYLYHIFGKKIGVTCDLKDRLTRQQGYACGEYEVLDSSDDIDYISEKELELQLVYGYKVDRQSYKQLITSRKTKKSNQMVLNVTEQTTTFPCPVNKLKGQLLDAVGLTFETPFGNYLLNKELNIQSKEQYADKVIKDKHISLIVFFFSCSDILFN
jgi:hypothetical protein